jgi:class 3 adenylate cyclase
MSERQGPDLGAERLRGLFDELSTELEKCGQTAQLFVVGGAAMALAYDQLRLTRDVDAAFEPRSTIRQLAREIAERHRMEADWINDAACGLLPIDGPDHSRHAVIRRCRCTNMACRE